jgi:hypothetical protein
MKKVETEMEDGLRPECDVQAYIAHITSSEQNAKDLDIIDERADDLNEEALDILDYQVAL